MQTLIYEDDGGNITIRDDGHQSYPICFSEGDVSREAAADAAKAILAHLGERVPQNAVLASDVSFNEGLLRLAAAHERVVEFRYAKGKGENIETRRLIPQDVREVGDHLTFTGHDPDRDDVRAYRVDRMKGEVTVR